MLYRLFLTGLLIFSSLNGAALAATKSSLALEANEQWLGRELKQIGLSKSFIAESLKYYEPLSFEKVLTLNLLGFLKAPGQHMNHVNPRSVSEATQFVKKNQRSFDLAKERYDVPANVISSLLWIETRHGDDIGRFHIVSVYLHLLQADLPKNRKQLTLFALEKNKENQEYTLDELKKVMAEKTQKRKQWAQEQIIALASIRKKKHLDLTRLRGSYAGAMGLPQFIPSSYRDFAKSAKPGATPNLNKPADAILSVAYYLSQHGWQENNADSQVLALMKYNNSRDYADSILEISKQVMNTRVSTKETSESPGQN